MWGRKNVKVKRKKMNEISMGEKNVKVKRKKKRMKYESSLEYCGKRKR